MSFYASNSRIRVLDGTDTVFDTNENMPHIVAISETDQTVSFGNIPSTSVYWYTNYCAYYIYQPDYCYMQYNCDLVYKCDYTPGYYTYQFVCGYNYSFGSYSCGYQSVYVPSTYYCYYTYYCHLDYICNPNPPLCQAVDYQQWRYNAGEYSTDVNILDLPTDESNNPISIDFIVVQASGTRTSDRKSTRLNSSHMSESRMPSSA